MSRWADIIFVIPTTANFMAKLAQGKADDLASTVILASKKDIVLVPAMNVRMWLHKATQKNVKSLLDFGYQFIGPVNGEMACGEYGEGKMSSPRQIFSFLKKYFKDKNFFKVNKLNALVTSGPTREYIDPVRYISNKSSGKQGNINFSKDLKIKSVVSSEEMYKNVKDSLPVDIAVCAAAVVDFKPNKKKKNKLKKNDINSLSLNLEKNLDILEFLGKNNKNRPRIVVGFAAETENVIENSKKKLKDKYCDLIVANDVSKKNSGFSVDYNKVAIISKNGKIENIPRNKKSFIANIIAKKIVHKLLVDEKNIN